MNTADTAQDIAGRVAADPAADAMARATLRDIGRLEDSPLVHTARLLTPLEVGAALANRDWTWGDVLRANA